MSEKITPEQKLAICNLVSSSKLSISEAKEQVLKSTNLTIIDGGDEKPKKLSANEKKAIIAEKLIALGIEPLAEGDSLAKWETALSAAESSIAETPDDTDDTDELM